MTTPEKIDMFKLHKADYVTPKTPVLLDIAPARYLTITGQGEPGGDEFGERVGALYAAAFTIKMTRKAAGLGDFTICKLEAQWWADGEASLSEVEPRRWRWRLLIRTPEVVEEADLATAAARLAERGKGKHLDQVRLETIEEGRCVQMLHVGPYEREPETVAEMERFVNEQGLQLRGLHHEIYLSDPRRVPPDRLKTILRHPAG